MNATDRDIPAELVARLQDTKNASRDLARSSGATRDAALAAIATAVAAQADAVIEANERDLERGVAEGYGRESA